MKKTLKIVVLAKQVPDTRNVGKDAMKADGTVNRAALPAIFNPEDLNALEQALVLKDMFPGSTVEILTMGPGRAAESFAKACTAEPTVAYCFPTANSQARTRWPPHTPCHGPSST